MATWKIYVVNKDNKPVVGTTLCLLDANYNAIGTCDTTGDDGGIAWQENTGKAKYVKVFSGGTGLINALPTTGDTITVKLLTTTEAQITGTKPTIVSAPTTPNGIAEHFRKWWWLYAGGAVVIITAGILIFTKTTKK